jgi:ankyrin repeat protein
MNKSIAAVIKDGLIMTVAASVFAVVCNYGFSSLKGAGAKNDPLITATTQANSESITEILSEASFQADPEGTANLAEYRVLRTNKQDDFGRTALMWSAYANFLDRKEIDNADTKRLAIASQLLDAGANPNVRDSDGWTALMWSSWSGLTKISDLLIARGTDLNAVDKNGQNALMLAAMRGNVEIVQLLIGKGADKSLVSKSGKTAADYAKEATVQYPERVVAYSSIKAVL